jgi:hypothetical protein
MSALKLFCVDDRVIEPVFEENPEDEKDEEESQIPFSVVK